MSKNAGGKKPSNILTSLEVAMSRVKTNCHGTPATATTITTNNSNSYNSKVGEYVTDKLRIRGKELCDLICQRNTCVYICGDGNRMAKDVYNLFIELLIKYGSKSARHTAGQTSTAASHGQLDLLASQQQLQQAWGKCDP